MNINILSKNTFFAQDLKEQIQFVLTNAEVEEDFPSSKTDVLLTDNEADLQQISNFCKNVPIVLFSETEDTTHMADLIIKKPFRLSVFLDSLKNNSLLPKVRRKECINIKEYSLYPVKKEIYSSITTKSIKLTEREVEIIKYLYQIFPQSAVKEDLLENVWGYSADATTHTVETHIYRLRQKVEKDGGSQLIITENSGYRLNL
ncbi:MAG: response regulator transcription factor [Alphaproteobacteria bacterium]|nr:response regulator transcription factor [Alphaproteobacteria bacterium]